MDFPAILDVAIGLSIIFFILASICSLLVESVASWKRWRQNMLNLRIRRLLSDEKLEVLFWAHPQISPIRAADSERPAYLASTRFAAALADIATGEGTLGIVPNTRRGLAHMIDLAQARMNTLPAPSDTNAKDRPEAVPVSPGGDGGFARVRSLLRRVPENSADCMQALQHEIAVWYDEAMARVEGSYKRKVFKYLLLFAGLTTLLLNADALRATYVLFGDPELRDSMVEYARTVQSASAAEQADRPDGESPATGEAPSDQQAVSMPDGLDNVELIEIRKAISERVRHLQALERVGFPIGWIMPFRDNFLPLTGNSASSVKESEQKSEEENFNWAWAWFLKICGLGVTVFSVALGAPFWFDLLNRLVKLRGVGAKPDVVNPNDLPSRQEPAIEAVIAGGPVAAAVSSAPAMLVSLPSAWETLSDPQTSFSAAKAYWLGRASELAYDAPEKIEQTLGDWGFKVEKHFEDEQSSTQAYLAIAPGVAVLAFRGTEPRQIVDWFTDAQAKMIESTIDFDGRVHEGFAGAMKTVRDAVNEALSKLPATGCLLYVTGHSLGGALATLASYGIARSTPDERRVYPVQGVYTFGSPRVGDQSFVRSYQELLGPVTWRVVNNEDLVTRVAPRAMGYDHVGRIIYIDASGTLQTDVGFWYRFLNFAANAAENLREASRTTVRDHGMVFYCEHLRRAVRDSKATTFA